MEMQELVSKKNKSCGDCGAQIEPGEKYYLTPGDFVKLCAECAAKWDIANNEEEE